MSRHFDNGALINTYNLNSKLVPLEMKQGNLKAGQKAAKFLMVIIKSVPHILPYSE